jgi:hypothetical protein
MQFCVSSTYIVTYCGYESKVFEETVKIFQKTLGIVFRPLFSLIGACVLAMTEPAARVHCFFDINISGRLSGRIIFEVCCFFFHFKVRRCLSGFVAQANNAKSTFPRLLCWLSLSMDNTNRVLSFCLFLYSSTMTLFRLLLITFAHFALGRRGWASLASHSITRTPYFIALSLVS